MQLEISFKTKKNSVAFCAASSLYMPVHDVRRSLSCMYIRRTQVNEETKT